MRDAKGLEIATLAERSTARAHLRLFVAAPNLIAMLKEARAFMWDGEEGRPPLSLGALIARIDGAILEAEGKPK